MEFVNLALSSSVEVDGVVSLVKELLKTTYVILGLPSGEGKTNLSFFLPKVVDVESFLELKVVVNEENMETLRSDFSKLIRSNVDVFKGKVLLVHGLFELEEDLHDKYIGAILLREGRELRSNYWNRKMIFREEKKILVFENFKSRNLLFFDKIFLVSRMSLIDFKTPGKKKNKSDQVLQFYKKKSGSINYLHRRADEDRIRLWSPKIDGVMGLLIVKEKQEKYANIYMDGSVFNLRFCNSKHSLFLKKGVYLVEIVDDGVNITCFCFDYFKDENDTSDLIDRLVYLGKSFMFNEDVRFGDIVLSNGKKKIYLCNKYFVNVEFDLEEKQKEVFSTFEKKYKNISYDGSIYVTDSKQLFRSKPIEKLTVDCLGRDNKLYVVDSFDGGLVEVSYPIDGFKDGINEYLIRFDKDVVSLSFYRERKDKIFPNSSGNFKDIIDYGKSVLKS